MSKLDLAARVPLEYERQTFADIIRAICGQVNPLSEGKLAARYNAQASVPTGTAASFAVGDFVPDSNCTVTNGSVRLGWVCTAPGTPGTFQEARALIANFGQITNTLGADVALNNTANYFDAASAAQGASGVWLAIGNVSFLDTAGAATFFAKLWDGTNVKASSAFSTYTANAVGAITLVGVFTSPPGNIRISVKDTTSTSGAIKFNSSGNSADSTITVIRIG